jgi:hypothetical protein
MLSRNILAAAIFVLASQLALAAPRNPVEIANAFWRDVWQARNPAAVDQYVVDDFVITTGGKDISSRENFKAWVADFQSRIGDLKLEVLETFASADGTRTVSRLRLTGDTKGMMGLPPDARPFTLTVTSILAFRDDGRILSASMLACLAPMSRAITSGGIQAATLATWRCVAEAFGLGARSIPVALWSFPASSSLKQLLITPAPDRPLPRWHCH